MTIGEKNKNYAFPKLTSTFFFPSASRILDQIASYSIKILLVVFESMHVSDQNAG
jgi:hypothetical protein